MKKTRRKADIALALEFIKIRNVIKELKEREIEIKTYFDSIMDDDRHVVAGEVIIYSKEQSRTDIDKAKLLAELGPKKIKKFEKQTFFVRFFIKHMGEK